MVDYRHNTYNMEREVIIARLIGHMFGDGWISKAGSVGFSGKGNDKDLLLIKRDLEQLGFSSSKIYKRECISEITTQAGKKLRVIGKGSSFSASTRAYNFFVKLGVPIGDKPSTDFRIPIFIIDGSKDVKKEFLAALMGSDGYLQSTLKKSPQSFHPVRISFNKIEELEESALEYANQLKTLFEEFGVRVSQIKKFKANVRKNGQKTYKFVITLSNSVENMKNFLETTGFRYCLQKELESKKRLLYLKAKLSEMDRLEEVASKIRKMNNGDLSSHKIARLTGINRPTVTRWVRNKDTHIRAYTFPSYEKWCKNQKFR